MCLKYTVIETCHLFVFCAKASRPSVWCVGGPLSGLPTFRSLLEPTAVTARGLGRFVESWSALSLQAACFKASSYTHTVLKKGISGRESLGAYVLNTWPFFSVVTG